MGNKQPVRRRHSSVKSESSFDPRSSIFPHIKELAKILLQKAEAKNIQGISSEIFEKNVFPFNQDLGRRLFTQMKEEAKAFEYLNAKEFCSSLQKIFANQKHVNIFLRMYGKNEKITSTGFRDLIFADYTIAMDQYHVGIEGCPYYARTIQSIVDGAFQKKTKLSQLHLSSWILSNCPKFVEGIYQFTVHHLNTSHCEEDDETFKLEFSIPVVEQECYAQEDVIFPVSEVWLLAVSLPELFTRHSRDHDVVSYGLSATKSARTGPSNWTILYQSDDDGLGSSAFSRNVLLYPDPTIMIIKCKKPLQICIACSCEWREKSEYWGTTDCRILQIHPTFSCKLKDWANSLYFNETNLDHPLGIRAGDNPHNPILSINHDFTVVSYEGTPYNLLKVVVLGCGTEAARKSQLDMKKRRKKDVNRARTVKMFPEDSPDRSILKVDKSHSIRSDSIASDTSASMTSSHRTS